MFVSWDASDVESLACRVPQEENKSFDSQAWILLFFSKDLLGTTRKESFILDNKVMHLIHVQMKNYHHHSFKWKTKASLKLNCNSRNNLQSNAIPKFVSVFNLYEKQTNQINKSMHKQAGWRRFEMQSQPHVDLSRSRSHNHKT